MREDRLKAKFHKKLLPLLVCEFNVRRLRHVWPDRYSGQFRDDIYDAGDADKITDEDERRLLGADLVAHAQQKPGGATIWFAAEASIAIDKDTIDRARQSADAINNAYEQDAVPVVYGYRIDDPQREHAREQGVEVFLDPGNPADYDPA